MAVWAITSLGFMGYGIYHFWRTIIIQWDQVRLQIAEKTRRGEIVWPEHFQIDEDQIAFHFCMKGRPFSVRKSRIVESLRSLLVQRIRREQAAASDRDKAHV